jgi:uncharacterized membrane protein YhdT
MSFVNIFYFLFYTITIIHHSIKLIFFLKKKTTKLKYKGRKRERERKRKRKSCSKLIIIGLIAQMSLYVLDTYIEDMKDGVEGYNQWYERIECPYPPRVLLALL